MATHISMVTSKLTLQYHSFRAPIRQMCSKTMAAPWNSSRLQFLCTRTFLQGRRKLPSFLPSQPAKPSQTNVPTRQSSHSSLPVQPKTLQDCYQLFCVDEFCTIEELRSAYEITTKRYSGNIEDIQEIHRAYYRILKSWSEKEQSRTVEPQSKYLLSPQPDQSRTYLRYEGVGYEGPPDNNQHNTSSVNSRPSPFSSGSLFYPGSSSISIDTMTERLSQLHGANKQEMIEDLPGFGKPLPDEYEHPYTDPVQAKLNKIMINSDVGTEWMELKKEFQEELKLAKLKLQSSHDSIQRQPGKQGGAVRWNRAIAEFKDDIKNVNKKVESYNLSVPMMSLQRMPFNAERELKNLQQQWQKSRLEKGETSLESNQSNNDPVKTNTSFLEKFKSWISKS